MKKYMLATVLALAAQGGHAAQEPIICPPELPAEALRIVSPKGWKPFVASPLYLHDAAPISGPPERLGALVAIPVKSGKSAWTVTYNLDDPFPEGKWFMCGYGYGNEFTISKRLDDSVKECVVKGKKGDKFGQNIFDIQCK